MILDSSFAISTATLAALMVKATEGKATAHFLSAIKAYVFQRSPAAGEKAWQSPRVLSGSFTFRVELKPQANNVRGEWHTLDDVKFARAIKIIASSYADVYGRIASGKATNADACFFLQIALFGYVRFDVVPPKAPRKAKAAA